MPTYTPPPPDVVLEVKIGPTDTIVPTVAAGEAVVLLITATNSITGQPVDAAGWSLTVIRPDTRLSTAITPPGVVQSGPGQFWAELALDVPGVWSGEIVCTEPRRSVAKFRLRAVGLGDEGDALLADLGTIINLPGTRPFRAALATSLVPMEPLTGAEVIIGVQEDGEGEQQARVVPVQGLLDATGAAGAAAGASAGAAAGATAGGSAGAAAGASAGAASGGSAGSASGATAGGAAAAAVVATKADFTSRLRRFGVKPSASLVKPVVFVFAGQSNMQGAGIDGSKVVDQSGAGIWFYSNMSGASGGVMNRAAFGVAPFNKRFIGGGEEGTTSSDPDQVTNNQAVHFMNELRTRGAFPSDVPLWGIMNSIGGNSLNKWVPNGPNFTDLVGGLATMQAAWDAQRAAAGLTGSDPLQIIHMCWQQGEGDSTTLAGTYNTFDAYVAAFGTFLTQLRALPNWTADTTLSVGEAGRWRPRLNDAGTAILSPGNQRNDAMRYLGSGQFDPQVLLVSSDGLTNAYTDNDASHFNGPSLVTLGQRHAQAFLAARQGTIGLRAPRTKEGHAFAYRRRVDATNQTLILGEDDVAGNFYLRCANADVRLPGLNAAFGIVGTIEVWSASSSNTIIRPSNDLQTLSTEDGLVATASLGVGIYSAEYAAGRWIIRAVSPRRGDYVPVAQTVPNGGSLGLGTALDVAVQSFGGYVGLPTPTQGARIAVQARSLTYGNTQIGRALNTVAVAAGGSGYAVGDTVALALGGATGAAPVVVVKTVGAGGAILTVDWVDRGCVTSSGAVSSPLSQASTSGAGTGATFTISITSALFYEGGASAAALTLTKANETITLQGIGAGYTVISRVGGTTSGGIGRPAALSYATQSVTLTEADVTNGASLYLQAANVTLPALASGFTATLLIRVWSVTGGNSSLVAPGTGLINWQQANVDSVSLGLGVYEAFYTGNRWVVVQLPDLAVTAVSESSGTFTPTLTNSTPGDLSVSYSVQTGNYVKHGKIVSFRATLTATPTYTTASGYWSLAGLPFSAASGTGSQLPVRHSSNLNYGTGKSTVMALISGTIARLRVQGSASGDADLAATGIASGTAVSITITGTYEVP